MDLRKEWQQLHQQKFNYSPIEKDQIMKAIYQESRSTLTTLKKRLRTKQRKFLYGTLPFIAIMILCIIFYEPFIAVTIGVILPINIVILIAYGLLSRQLNTKVDSGKPVLVYIKKQYQQIRKVLHFEKLWLTFITPLCVFLAGIVGAYYGERTYTEITAKPIINIIMLILIFGSAPLVYFDTERKNRSLFGNLLNDLKNNIRRMEDLA